MADILIVEDNAEIAHLLRDFIVKESYTCDVVASGEDALRYLEHHKAGIVLLDILLPGIDGLAVCDIIHKTHNTPIIILSARTEKDVKLSALQLGADDYIEKPYDVDLVLAKIAALHRRHYEDKDEVFEYDGLLIETTKHSVKLDGAALSLTSKEYELLLLLVKNAGKTLRKEFLFNIVWGSSSLSEPSTLTVHIKWLREKIERDPKNPLRIQTVWGVGYRFETSDEEL